MSGLFQALTANGSPFAEDSCTAPMYIENCPELLGLEKGGAPSRFLAVDFVVNIAQQNAA